MTQNDPQIEMMAVADLVPYYIMELAAPYVDVIVKRWQEFTGKQATHAATGATFAEVEADSALAVAEAV